ncbi:hypothetical protein ACSDQ9_03070 [Aestuariimicrobium soli]|uniref:hypothetical protein n=1 Tax=Aestuariimicrobium soli TaxID=2035834 RepID=UPI003EBEE1C9
MATLIIGFLLGAFVVPTASDLLGTATYDLETGRGRAAVSSCWRAWPWQECQARLTSWSGSDGHQVGEKVLVRGRKPLTGTVEVVGRVRGVSTIDEYKQTTVTTEEVLLSADVWVMPSWARIPLVIGLGLVWLALIWGAARLVHRWTAGRAVE